MSTTHPIKGKKQLEEFKDYYMVSKPNPRNYTLIVIGLNTAFRIGDLLRLQWKDVYDKDRHCFLEHICLIEQKTHKERVVAINNATRQALEQYRGSCSDSGETSYLFASAKNKSQPITRVQAYRLIKQAAVAVGMTEHISCHSLRKTFGYYAWKQGVPPAMLMQLYNHSSYRITKHYLSIEQEEQDDVFRTIQL